MAKMLATQLNGEVLERRPEYSAPLLAGVAEVVDPWADAACQTGDEPLTDLFFSDELADIAAAKAICATCPLVVPCLEGALERREPAGVWGGQLFVNGRVLPKKRRRGRPPKHPRPGIMLSA
jgi:WhiB family transcriptional regulator, redox-sensing transcriptional regulator